MLEKVSLGVLVGIMVAGCMLDLPEHADGFNEGAMVSVSAALTANDIVGRYETNWGPLTLSVPAGGAGIVGYYGEPSDVFRDAGHLAQGRLAGTIVRDRLEYYWQGDESGKSGHGYFTRTEKGLAGRFGYGDDDRNGGEWSGSKM
jgi:hypothetical protein